MVIARRLITFARLGWRRQALFLEALALVGFAWVATRALPFRWVRPLYGRPRAPGTPDVPGVPGVSDAPDGHVAAPGRGGEREVDPFVREVCWALHMVHSRLSWDRSCLARAIAGRIMLRRRGYAPTLYLGAHRRDGSDVEFHAWLMEHGAPVTGVRGSHPFTTLAVFDSD